MSRVQRYQREYQPKDGCESDEEEYLSAQMFLDDIKELRNIVKTAMLECLNGQIKCEKEFARERHFFMEKLEKDAETRRKLET